MFFYVLCKALTKSFRYDPFLRNAVFTLFYDGRENLVLYMGFAVFGWVLLFFFEKQVNWSALIVISILVSVISQFGDLAASMIKREMNIKDYGSIFPGHGGVLDRFDSVIFTAPIIYYLAVYLIK